MNVSLAFMTAECKFTNKFIVNVVHELMFVNVSSFYMNVRPYVRECKPML